MSATAACSRSGCTKVGTHAPVVCVPAQGHAIETHNPLRCELPVPLCKDHFEEATAAELLTPQMREALTATTKAMRLAAPDFDRAFLRKMLVDSPEYRTLLARTMRTDGRA